MKVLVLGANGQLGSDIVRLWTKPGLEVVSTTRADADVTDESAVHDLLQSVRPNVTVNTTAYHNLDEAELHPLRAFVENACGGWNVARAATKVGSRTVQISTDYVFDGSQEVPYFEGNGRRAVNVYGTSKIATEDLVLGSAPDALIVRVSGLYGLVGSRGKGGNFPQTMLGLADKRQAIRVVDDQFSSPTNTAEIAEALLGLIESETQGVVHLGDGEGCSWFEFAKTILELSGVPADLKPVTTEEFGAPVRRPAYSVLGTSRVPPLRHWRLGLERYLRERGLGRGTPIAQRTAPR